MNVVAAQPVQLRDVPPRVLIEIEDGESTPRDLSALPDSQPIRLDGRTTTLGTIRADMRREQQRREQAAVRALNRAAAAFAGHRSRFDAAQRHQHAMQARQARAELSRLASAASERNPDAMRNVQQLSVLRAEAIDLRRKLSSANAEERARILQRADEMLRELDAMGLETSR